MLARLSAFVIWALVAAAAVFWGLQLVVRAPSAPPYAVAVADIGAANGDLTRLLGSTPAVAAAPGVAAPEASSRFRLLGIAAPKSPGALSASHGVALIAVDGKMPKAYAVGAKLDGDLVLQSLSLRTVSIAPPSGAPAITLELPPPVAAATGTLSMGGAGMVDVARPVAAPVPRYAPPPQAIPQPAMPAGATPPAGAMPAVEIPGQVPAHGPAASPR